MIYGPTILLTVPTDGYGAGRRSDASLATVPLTRSTAGLGAAANRTVAVSASVHIHEGSGSEETRPHRLRSFIGRYAEGFYTEHERQGSYFKLPHTRRHRCIPFPSTLSRLCHTRHPIEVTRSALFKMLSCGEFPRIPSEGRNTLQPRRGKTPGITCLALRIDQPPETF